MTVGLYALAYLGAHLAFMPLLVLLLPRRVDAVAGADAATMLSWLLLAGASMAALAHIVAGHLSDRWHARHGNRRGLILAGLVALAASYAVLSLAETFAQLLVAMLFYQAALNFAFAPLGALLADHFPDHQKGRMGGLMNAALPASHLSVVIVGMAFPEDRVIAFLVTAGLVVACFLPLLLRWPFATLAAAPGQAGAGAGAAAVPAPIPVTTLRTDFALAWSARLAVQLGAAFIQGYIYLYLLETLAIGEADPQASASRMLATVSGPAAVVAIVVTVLAGSLSDRFGQRRLPLTASALLASLGMVLLSQGADPALFVAGYALFYTGLSAFLSVDTALVAQLVSGSPRRGALLGVMNLTNTLPSVIAPVLTLIAFHDSALQDVLGQLFILCAVLAVLAGIAIQFVRSVR